MDMEPMRGNALQLQMICGTPIDFGYTEQFCIPGVTSLFFWCLTVLLGTLWRSIKQIEVPYMFDWEPGIPLHASQGNRASSCSEVEVS